MSKFFTVAEFTKSETALKNGIDNSIPDNLMPNLIRLMDMLDKIRERFGSPIKVNSGYRCEALNKLVGGVKLSQHRFAQAADITSKDNIKLYNLIKEMISNKEITVGQLGNEHNLCWIHISTPSSKHTNEYFSTK